MISQESTTKNVKRFELLFWNFCDQILVFNFLVYAFKQNSSKYSFTVLLLFDAHRKPTNPINF